LPFEELQDPGQAGCQQETLLGEFACVYFLVSGQCANNPPLLFRQAVSPQHRAKARHRGFSRFQ
jgi:hypothetical protein